MKSMLAIIFFAAIAAGAGEWYLHSNGAADLTYRTAQVTRGDVVYAINASGTLEPEEVVDVGAQVAGLIESFGKDSNGNSIDYRSPVEPNMVLAHIDDTVYNADVATAAAELEQAKAMVPKSEADVAQAKAKLLQAEHNWNRAKTMGPSDALSQNDYDMYLAEYETAKANVAVAETEITQANSGILLANAALSKAQRNLDFCTIRSPVKGVIIDRRVNIGQTVVSSLNAPSLFLIAKDLTRMQIWVSVNEADVGRIVPGGPVTFECEAFPDQTFLGRVGKVRLNAMMNQNVVTYTVEVEADNSKNILLPYMTAKVQFEVSRATNTLMVPNPALHWIPTSESQLTAAARAALASTTPTTDPTKSKVHHGTIWITEGSFVRPVDVLVGITDGANTAVSADELREGDQVVTGEESQAVANSQKNPFMPIPQRR